MRVQERKGFVLILAPFWSVSPLSLSVGCFDNLYFLPIICMYFFLDFEKCLSCNYLEQQSKETYFFLFVNSLCGYGIIDLPWLCIFCVYSCVDAPD